MIRFDVKYKFDIEVETNGYHEFFGERGWTLHWSETYKGFILDNPLGYLLNDDVIAIYNDTQEYPLGLKKWNIMNDNCPGNGEHYLSFSSCSKSQFTCNDGACVRSCGGEGMRRGSAPIGPTLFAQSRRSFFSLIHYRYGIAKFH